MRNEATLIRRGADLSADLKEALEGSENGAIYAIQIRRLSAEDAALFAEIRAQVKTGLDQVVSGQVYSEEEAFRLINRPQ